MTVQITKKVGLIVHYKKKNNIGQILVSALIRFLISPVIDMIFVDKSSIPPKVKRVMDRFDFSRLFNAVPFLKPLEHALTF